MIIFATSGGTKIYFGSYWECKYFLQPISMIRHSRPDRKGSEAETVIKSSKVLELQAREREKKLKTVS